LERQATPRQATIVLDLTQSVYNHLGFCLQSIG
jgi:hypothetical protein